MQRAGDDAGAVLDIAGTGLFHRVGIGRDDGVDVRAGIIDGGNAGERGGDEAIGGQRVRWRAVIRRLCLYRHRRGEARQRQQVGGSPDMPTGSADSVHGVKASTARADVDSADWHAAASNRHCQCHNIAPC